jgi:hypothetical protein
VRIAEESSRQSAVCAVARSGARVSNRGAARRFARGACVALGVLGAGPAAAQDLEPRAYAANPIGARFALVSLGYSAGDVVLEATSPLSDVDAKAYAAVLGLGGTFALLSHTASVAVAVPYAWATVTGTVAEATRTVDRSGLADIRVRAAVSLLGGRALAPAEFARRTPSTVVGASITISAPTGQYFADKLVNVGTNRWAFKPEIGVSRPAGPWTLELSGGGWFFTRNSSYFGNKTKDQRAMLSLQTHVGYTFRPRLWATADATYYSGGRTVIDDVAARDRQENTRIGLTMSFPVRRAHSVKLAWSSGAITRLGGDFDTWSATWQTTAIRRPR